MARLVADIVFSAAGNSEEFVRDGWGEPEIHHRWTMGRESRLSLPRFESDSVLVIDATPCLHPPGLHTQTVMLAINDRLLATATFPGLRVLAFRLPDNLTGTDDPVLSILHLNAEAPRAPEQIRRGQTLGLMVHSIRLYALDPPRARQDAPRSAPRSREELALCFESLG